MNLKLVSQKTWEFYSSHWSFIAADAALVAVFIYCLI